MSDPATSQHDRAYTEDALWQSMLGQAEAAASSQQDANNSKTDGLAIQEADLLTPGWQEDDAPPAYGEMYGEIRAENDGLGTSASVGDDGRINIRINQLNRRLSQVFTPALRQYVESAQESGPPPPPGASPPPLNIVMHVVGSRGDVQPFIALGKLLKDTYGHRVRLATHPNFKSFVQEHGLEFFSIGGDPSQLMAFMVKNPALMPGFRSIANGDVGKRRNDVAEYMQGCWRSCFQAGDGLGDQDLPESAARPFVADCIIANPPSFAHIHCAEKLGIPLHIMFTMPYSPTQAFPHALANIQSSNADPQLTNYLTYSMIEVLSWQGLGDIINRFRARCLALDPVGLAWAPGMLQRLKIPHTYCWSPALVPKPKDWGPHISVPGFCFLDSEKYTPPPELQAFLDAGPPPVYIGFGSIVLDDPNALTDLIFEAVKKAGPNLRVLLSKGWGGMGANELHIAENIYLLGNVPHDWLFRRVSCVVHHGGAGTTAAGIAAGLPTVVVPFFGDQPFWGAMIARAGAGPDPIPHKQLTADRLVGAINFCLQPGSHCHKRAQELANQVASEQGSEAGAQAIHQHLQPDRLRCMLAPTRAAAWRIKRTKIRLSPFAACTLANAGLLDFRDLKLYRPQEYETDKGPWDPITGGFVAVAGAFGEMMGGLTDLPGETYKASKLPFRRQQSHPSSSDLGRRETTDFAGPSTQANVGAEPSQTNREIAVSHGKLQQQPSTSTLASQNTIGKLQKRPSASTLEPRAPTDGPRSMSDAAIELAKFKHNDYTQRQERSRDKGIGRFMKAVALSPVEVSMALTKGSHNLPRLWGDDTVRPHAQVTSLASGVRAAGKNFGLGWYDGLTGLVTQPWNGAQKEGAAGFAKGVGKGVGGILTKMLAGSVGLVGYTFKGVHKEFQKASGGNVQKYIITSRTAQGYEDWLQSSEAEKQDVIARWELARNFIKKRSKEEAMQDVLDVQQQQTAKGGKSRAGDLYGEQPNDNDAGFNRATSPAASMLTLESSLLHAVESRDSMVWPAASEVDEAETIRPSIEALRDSIDYRSDASSATVSPPSSFHLPRRRSEAYPEPAYSSQAGPSSRITPTIRRKAVPTAPSPRQPPPSEYDLGHLEGTTQSEYEAQRRQQPGEKTAQEKSEEEIVLAYVKKQSLLEAQHRERNGMRRATEEGEEFQRALQSSLQE